MYSEVELEGWGWIFRAGSKEIFNGISKEPSNFLSPRKFHVLL
jgi:hypothetical protein